MDYILSIDHGTTGSRAIVYDRAGAQVASAYREFTQYYPQPGWVEHDPEEIWRSVYATIQEVLGQVPPESIRAIGIANQRETTVVWDREDGRSICNAIVWQCRRTSERCDQLRSREGFADLVRESTGLPIDAYFSATKIEWVLDNVSGARERAERGELLFGTTDSWLIWKLTGGAVHATDPTNASRTMLFDIDRLAWDSELTDTFGVPASMLPEVVPSSGIAGHTVRIGDLPAGIPISGIAGDQQAALFGQACFEPGTVKNTYGTGSFILLNTGDKRPTSDHGLITTLACGVGKPVYALEGAVFVAGAALQWLRDGLGILPSAPESERMAGSVDDNGGVYFVPALSGLGAPYWDQDARGAIFGLTRGVSAAHLVRAALEAICYQTHDVLAAMRKDTGLDITSLKVDGGAAASDFICQFQADISGIEVVRPKVIETTSLGAAYLAGLAIGYWTGPADISACWSAERVFSPRMSSDRAEALYGGWKDAVGRTLTR